MQYILTTNVKMYSNVIQIDTNVIKLTNAMQTLYARKIAAFSISWTKVRAAFEKQYPIAFNRKSTFLNNLGIV